MKNIKDGKTDSDYAYWTAEQKATARLERRAKMLQDEEKRADEDAKLVRKTRRETVEAVAVWLEKTHGYYVVARALRGRLEAGEIGGGDG